jgi:hypothetical protein
MHTRTRFGVAKWRHLYQLAHLIDYKNTGRSVVI